jgi:hypothetical protein
MVIDEILSAGTVKNIAELIEACNFPQDTLLLIERQPDQVISEKDKQKRRNLLRFAYLHQVGKVEIQHATSGRVFQRDFELRWEKSDQGYQVVYLGVERRIAGLEPDKVVLQEVTRSSEPRHYYLFGTKLDTEKLQGPDLKGASGYFAEVRIPRLLQYPVSENAGRVKLSVREYTDDGTGQVQLFRFQGLKEVKEQA